MGWRRISKEQHKPDDYPREHRHRTGGSTKRFETTPFVCMNQYFSSPSPVPLTSSSSHATLPSSHEGEEKGGGCGPIDRDFASDGCRISKRRKKKRKQKNLLTRMMATDQHACLIEPAGTNNDVPAKDKIGRREMHTPQ
jgi:hypothetical protein